jgi:hypothetical protein
MGTSSEDQAAPVIALARSEAPSYQSYLRRDSRAVPPALAQESRRDLGTAADRYTSQEFFDL